MGLRFGDFSLESLLFTIPKSQGFYYGSDTLRNEDIGPAKGRLRATIFESAETVHLILLCYFGDAVRWAVSAEKQEGRLQSSLTDDV